MRMTASWFRIKRSYRIQVCGTKVTPMASSPQILNRQQPSDAEAVQKPLSQSIIPPRAQASRRCQTQAPLSGKPPSCAKRFGPLTPSARCGNLIAGDGTENGLPAPNKELAINRKQPLDRKSPIQVRIHLPPAKSQVRTCAGRRAKERAILERRIRT